MCNIDAISVNSRALFQDTVYITGQACGMAIAGAEKLLQFTWTVISDGADIAERVFRSPDALNYTLLGIQNAVSALAPASTVAISQNVIDKLDTAYTIVSVTRLVQSFEYFAKGKFFDDIHDGKYGKFLGEISFCLARAGNTINFLVNHNLMTLAPITQAIGQIPVFGAYALNALAYPLVDGFFMAGCISYSFESVIAILNGKDIVYNLVSLANLIAETAMIRLSLLTAATINPLVIAGLGVVVATTGIASFLLEPKVEEEPVLPQTILIASKA